MSLPSESDTNESVDLDRYGRQVALKEVGLEGQRRLRAASILVVGLGGLGTPAALYLAAAGVGRLGLVDGDRVERSNLHRQVLYGEGDVGDYKVDAAARRLQEQNPRLRIEKHPLAFGAENATELLKSYDIVLDGTDVFRSRYLINDACVQAGVPDVSASIHEFEGQLSVFAAGDDAPCYRCLFPDPPRPDLAPSCAEGGVLGILPGLLGVLQATEALKLILRIGSPLVGRLMLIDALAMRTRTLHFERDPACPACGIAPHAIHHPDPPHLSSTPPMATVPEISVREYQQLRSSGNPPFLLDVRRQDEYDIANLAGALIPLDELPQRIDELDPHRGDELLVVHCRSGARSAKAVEMLQNQGFSNAVNLKGGILAWSDEIDPSVQKY